MWQRFTEGARKAVFYAQEEAQRTGEGYVGAEHLTLGLLKQNDSSASELLKGIGIDVATLYDQIRALLPSPSGASPPDMTLNPRAKRTIDSAYYEAQSFGSSYIGTEHLLLGIVKEGESSAARALIEAGATLQALREQYTKRSGATFNETPPEPKPTIAPSPKSPSLETGSGARAAMLLMIRHGRLKADMLALLVINGAPETIEEGLLKLGLDPDHLLELVEAEILSNTTQRTPPPIDRLLELGRTPKEMFVAVATEFDSCLRNVMTKRGISAEQVREAFA